MHFNAEPKICLIRKVEFWCFNVLEFGNRSFSLRCLGFESPLCPY
jgi:hypothetical protein